MCSRNSTESSSDTFNSSSLVCSYNISFSFFSINSTNHRFSVEKFIGPSTVTLLVILSVIGNGLLFNAIRASKIFRRPVNFMLGNLAMASIMASLGGLSLYTLKSLSPRIPRYLSWICWLTPVLGRLPQPAETYSVLYISMDRCRVVMNPWKMETRMGARKKIIFTWIGALLMELPRALFHDCYEVSDGKEFQCYNRRQIWGYHEPYVVYTLLYALLVYWIPSLLLLGEFGRIVYTFQAILTSPCNVYMKMIAQEDLLRIHAGQKQIACRNAFLFIFIFILIQLPVGTWYSVYDLPPSVVPASVRLVVELLKPWLLIVYTMHYGLYPLLVFFLSSQIRTYYHNMIFGKS